MGKLVLLGIGCALVALCGRADADEVASLSATIDRLIAQRWEAEQIVPAPLADDAEFLRRLHLDLCGRIPRASEVRDFLADKAPDKRRREIDRLLKTPTFVIHHTNLWRAAMIPEADASQEIRFQLPGFEAWLRSRIAENRNFAEIAREMLTLPLSPDARQQFAQPESSTPVAFFQAKEFRVERLAAATSRLFLGVRIDCAQCHDHPFDHWKQPEFWSFAALFGDLAPFQPGEEALKFSSDRRKITIPDTERTVDAAYLGQPVGEWKHGLSGRELLADWITSPENPYFARAIVNRLWSYHFGQGLVDPMDDFSDLNPASHPELLNLLANEFVAHDYDVKWIIRAITNSRTYQLTSRQTEESQGDRRLFARMFVRGLTPEQIFDSLAQATGYRQPFDPEQPLNFNNDESRQEFIGMFANESDTPIDRATTILQALTLMNGQFVGAATDLTDSRTLAAIIDAPFLDVSGQVVALYLATLNRFPTDVERTHCVEYITGGGPKKDPKSALGDLFWALLNSGEFLLNH